MTLHTPNKPKNSASTTGLMLALEPRFMFDAAGVATGAEVAVQQTAQQQVDHVLPAAQTDAAPKAESPDHASDSATNIVSVESVEMGHTEAVTTLDSHTELANALSNLQISSNDRTEIVFVDTRVADYQSLLSGIDSHAQLVLLDTQSDGVSQIANTLSAYQNVDAIHLISHGNSGQISLGSAVLNVDSMNAQHAESLRSISQHLSSDADILVYGCDFAAGNEGLLAVNRLAELTGADVAASSNETGAASQGGDWKLETQSGNIESKLAISQTTIDNYDELLAAPTITDTTPNIPVAVGENATNTPIGQNITVFGTGTDSLTVTSSVSKGSLSGTTFTGTAVNAQTFIQGLTYNYTSTSQIGDTDSLTINITNNDTGGTSTLSRNISIAPQNDIPTLTPPASGAGRLAVAEGGSQHFAAATGVGPAGAPVSQINLGLADPDNTQSQIIIKISGQPSQGVIKLNGNELTIGSTFAVSDIPNLVYEHRGTQVLSATTDTFRIAVDDGAGGLLQNQTVTVDITPVNQGPSASGTITLIEGETNVSLVGGTLPAIGGARGDLTITDPDDASDTHNVTVTALPANGTLQYNGSNLSLGQVITNANLALFTYSHNGTETSSDSFKITVTDDGGGTGTPATSAEQTINLVILSNNDDPVLATNTGVHFGPDFTTHPDPEQLGGTSVTLTPAMLKVTDTESPDNRLTYELTAIPDISKGYLTYGSTGLALPVGYTFTQQDIADGNIKFVSQSGGHFTTDFKFTVKDGDRRLLPNQRDGGIYDSNAVNAPLTVNTFNIHYDEIVTSGGGGGPGSGGTFPGFANPNVGGTLAITPIEIAEGQPITLTPTHLNTTDTDNTADQLTYRLLSLPENGQIFLNGSPLSLLGSFTQDDVNTGKVSFKHDGKEDFHSTFTFDVSDGQSKTAITTFIIEVKPQNDTPTASTDHEVKLNEGATKIITSQNINIADADNSTPTDSTTGYATDNLLSFKVTALPAHGKLQLNGVDVTVNDVITKADLTASKLSYVHDGTESYADQFTIVPLDDQGVTGSDPSNPTNQTSTGAALVIPVVIYPINDAPAYQHKSQLIAGEAGAIAEGSTATIGGALGYANTNGITGAGSPTLPANSVAHLVFGDNDNSTEQRQYRVMTAPSNGTLLLNGTALSTGSVFTQADLDSGRISYRHNGTETSTDFFDYLVSDGDFIANDSTSSAQGSSPPTASRYNIEILSSNDKPTVTASVSNLDVTASGGSYFNVPAISAADLDLDSLSSGETDFLRVEVSLLDSSNALVTGGKITYSAADPVAPGSGTDRHFVFGKDSNSLVIQGTKAEISAILSSLQVANTADRDSNTDKLHIVVDDRLYNDTGSLDSGANGGVTNQDGTPIDATNNRASTDITLLTSNSNDTPSISNPSSYSVNEDALLTLSGFSLSDADSFDKNVTVTVRLYNDAGRTTLATASEGTLTYSGLSNVTASGTGSNTVTLTGSMTNVQAALNSLKFDNAPDFNGTGIGTGNLYLRTTFTDFGHADVPAGNSVSVDNTISIIPVNDAPVLTVPGSTFVMASGTSVAIPGISFQDNKDTNQGASDAFYTVTIVAPTVGDSLAATASGSATSVYNSGSRTLIITGSRTDVNATLANLSYAPANSNADATYTLNVTVNDKDSGGIGNGKEGTGVDGNNIASNTVRVFVSGINDPAQITASNISVNEGSATLNLTSAVGGFTVNDSDDNGATNLSATVSVSQGIISAVGGSGGTISGTGSNTITITGASEAQINARLQALTVTFPDETGIPATADWNGNFNVTVTVNDNGNTGLRPASLTGDSNDPTTNPGDYAYFDGSSAALLTTRTISVTVNPVNDAPIRTDANPVTLPAVFEDVAGGVGNTPPGDIVANLFGSKFNDARDGITNGSTPNNFAGIAITTSNAISTQGRWQYSSDGNNWTNLPTVSTSSALLLKATDSLRFVPAANFHGTPGNLSVRLVDDSSGALTTGSTANVSNDSTLSGGTTRYSNSSNAVTLNTSVSNVNDRPTASNTTLTATTEDQSNPPGASVSSLGFGYSDVTDNRLSITGGGNASSAFGGIAIVGNLANSTTQGVWQYNTGSGWVDIGSGGAAPGDASALILPTTAQLRFLPNVANFNGTPGNLVIRVADSSQAFNAGSDISANLAQTDTWSQTVTLNTQVLKQNDAPTLTHTASNPTAIENALTGNATSIDPVNLLSAGSVADLDLASTAGLNANIFGAGKITITLSDGIAGDILQINGSLPSGVTHSGGTGNTPLVINLDNDTSLSDVESILAAIQYKNTSDNPTVFNTDTTRNYSIVVTDGNNLQLGGNAGGPAALSAATINGTITLVATNDPPVAIDMTNTAPIPASAGPTSIDLLTGTDVDGTIASITITSLPDPAQGRLFMADGVTAVSLNQVLTPTEAASLKFDPSGTYAGISTFKFTVTDNEGAVDATPATATITITNTPPVAKDDNGFGVLDQPVTLNVLSNDTDTENNLDPSTVKIVGTNTPGEPLVVSGEGTWSVNPSTGAITFTPLPGFINDPTPISYIVKDFAGASSNAATVIVDYPPFKPVALDDSKEGVTGQPVVIDVVANDVDPQSSLNPTTVKIVGTTNQGDPLLVPGEGTWSVNPTTGAITFTPLPGFTADPTPISYTVVDNNTGAPSNPASVSVDYPQTPPVANNDSVTGGSGQATTINVTGNDSDPENDLDPGSVKIVGTSNPGDSLIVPGQGTWSINPSTGAITFTPETGFTGDPTPISYTVKDRTGLSSNSATVSIDYPQTAPTAVNDSKTGVSGQAVSVNVVTNDSDPENDLDPTSVKIVGTVNPGDALFIADEGTWTVNPATGAITFTPLAGFTADPTPISYIVSDRTGLVSNAATVTVDYPQSAPIAVNDSVRGLNGQPASIDVINNDSDPENDLDPSSVKIVGTSNPGDPLVVAGEGTWSVDPTTGAITFTPEAGFIADPTPISYTVKDRTGLSSNPATVSVDYPPYAPVATDDSKSGQSGQPVIVDVLNNDSDPENDIDPTTVKIVGTTQAGESLVVINEGTWSINPSTGAITFTPITGFTSDPTPIRYTVNDSTGQTSNQATITIDYPQTPPVATNDSQTGLSGQPVVLDVIANDSDPENDLDPTSVKIVGTVNPGEPLYVANEGTWSVNPTTGAITFTPISGFTADPTPISYTVEDRIGLVSNPASVTVDYPQTAPLAINDNQSGSTGQPITVNVIANDSDPESDLDPSTVKIIGTSQPGESLVVNGEGAWSVNSTTGAITFTPEVGFTGDPTPIQYTVNDRTGQTSNPASVTFDYPQAAPVAVDDRQSGTSGQPVNVNVINNDSDPENDLDPTTVQIVGTANPGDAWVVTGEGTWSVNATTGAITFTPIGGFTADPTPIQYTVNDRTGLTSNQATVTVDYPQTAPTAFNDHKTGSLGQAVVINVLSNDTDPENDLDPTSVQIVGTANPGDSLVVAGQGTWSVNPTTGAITFRPISGFTGDPTPISYIVMDRTGLISNPATVTVDYPDFIPIPPDNIWNAGNGSITPPKPIDPPKVDLGIVDKPHFYPILQMLDRLNHQPFGLDHLDLSAFKPYRDIDLPIFREVDRIEHLRQFDDIFQRISSHGRSSWQLGGLRHSVTMQPKEVAADSRDFLSVHSTIVGNLLYVEFEHTVNQQAIYDIDHIHARLSDGRPLPEWLSFDQQNGLLSGIPPAGGEIIELQFSTTLQDGRVLSSAVEIEPDTGRLIKIEKPAQAVGHSRFTDQVKQSADRFNVEKNALRSALKP